MNSCLVKMTEDLSPIAGWCCSHQLLINPSKTKLIFFRTRQLLSKVSDIRLPFLDQELTPVSSVKDLGITVDSYLNFNDHVNTLTSSLLSMLCQISKVIHLFTKPVLSISLNSLIFSKLFYCSTVRAGTSKQNLQVLQLHGAKRRRARINPLSTNGDQHQFSPNDIHTLSRDMVMRMEESLLLITKLTKESYLQSNSLKKKLFKSKHYLHNSFRLKRDT